MAVSSLSAHLDRVHHIQQSLKQIQLRWFVTKQQKDDVGGRLLVQISIIDHSGNKHREWICQRAARENVQDFYDVPSHLLEPGHNYEFNVKLMSCDQSCVDDNDSGRLMQVLSTKLVNFRLGKYAMHGSI